MHPVTRRLATRPRRAFTLIELIVTIVILGILAALAVPAFNAVIERSRVATAEAYWEAVAREASALAAFSDTVAGPSHFATALADGGGTAAQVLAAGSEVSYTLDDGDGVLSEGEYIAVYESSTLWLFARPAGLDHVVAVQSLGGQLWAVFSSVPEAGHTDGAGGVLLPTDRLEDCCDVDGDGVADLVLTLDPAGSTHLDRMIVAGPPDQATVDAAGPELAIAGVSEGGTYHGTVELTLTATDASGVATVALDVDGTPLTLTDNGDGTHSTSWDTSSSDGATVLTASATDTPGNPSELVVNVTVALPTVTLAVANPSSLSASDTRLITSIEAAGYQVQVIDDADIPTHDHTSTVATVVAANTSISSAHADSLVSVPLLTFRTAAADFGTGGTSFCCWAGNLYAGDLSHPVAAGFTGTIDVTDETFTSSAGFATIGTAYDDATVVFWGSTNIEGVVARDATARHVLLGAAGGTAGWNAQGDQLIANILDWISVPVPSKPALTVTRSGTEATLSWDATTPASDSYQVSHRASGTTTWTTQTTTTPGAAITGLSATSLYDFRVRGVAADGDPGITSDIVTPGLPVGGTVAFSVGDPAALDSQLEQPFVDRLTARGLTPQLVAHADLATADLSSADLLVVPAMTATDSTAHPHTDIASLGVPVLSMNSWVSTSDLGLGSSRTVSSSYRNIRNIDWVHPVVDYLNAKSSTIHASYTVNGPMAGVYNLASDARPLAEFGFSSNSNLVVLDEPTTAMHFGAFRGDLLDTDGWATWDGAVSHMLSDVIDPPALPTISAGDAQLTVDWEPVAGATGYEVLHRRSSSTSYQVVNAGRTTDTQMVVTGLVNNDTYHVWVRSVDADGTSLSATRAASGAPTASADATLSALSIVVAVADPADHTRNEELLRSYLAARGATVTTIADSAVAAHDFSTTDVLVLPPTSTVASATVASLPVPTVVMDASVMAPLLSATASSTTGRDITVIDSTTSMTAYSPYNNVYLDFDHANRRFDTVSANRLDVTVARAGTSNEVLGGEWIGRRVAFYGQQELGNAHVRGWDKVAGAVRWASEDGPFAPADLALSRPSSGQVQVDWAVTGPAPDSHEVRHREVGATTWTTATLGATPSHTLTGLSDTTGYEVQVRASQGAETTDWTPIAAVGSYGGGVTVAFNTRASTPHWQLEQPLIDRLQALGYAVATVSDADLPTWTPTGDVLVVRPQSSTGTSAHPTFSTFDSIGMPVLSLDTQVATADLGLISSSGAAATASMYVSSTAHPISTALSPASPHTVYSTSSWVRYSGTVAAGAAPYMRLFNSDSYVTGVTDDTGTHRQAWFGMTQGNLLTGAGHYLFDQAVAWTAATP